MSSVPSSKKIRVFHQVLTNPTVFGGIKRFLYGLLKNSDFSRFEHILSPHPLGGLPEFRSLPIRIIQLPLAKYAVPHLKNLLLEEKIDVAHTCAWSHELAVAAKLAGIPHIWSIQGLIRLGGLGLPRGCYNDLINLIPRLSEKVVCASHFTKGQFGHPAPRNVRVIYNGVDFEEIRAAVSYQSRSKEHNGTARVAMLAHFTSPKRHIDLIRAAKKVIKIAPDAQFYIFGKARRNNLPYRGYLQKTISQLQLKQNFHFSYIPKDLYATLANMDILVLPSIDEGFGIAMIEGMALSKPVVAVRSGAMPEVVKNGQTGILVPPQSPHRLADALIHFVKDTDSAHQMGARGRKRAEKFFDVKKMVRQFEEVFEQAAGK